MLRFRRKVRGPSKETVIKHVSARLRGREVRQAATLETFAKLQTARACLLVRERSRLAAVHGPRSPEVERIDRAIRVQDQAAAVLRGEADRARIVSPRPDKDTVVVHGRAIDPKHAGVAKVEATLVDANGKVLARARTDDKGYFKLERRVSESQPADPASVTLVVTRGDEELDRRAVGHLRPGQAGYREFLVKG